jgi:phosphoribosyl 1,2-cyclic phosphodiesterase
MSAAEPPRLPLFAALPRRARCGQATLEFAVLGSSSSGNASVLRVATRESRRQILLDAGLSPRATFGAMRALGFTPEDTAEVLFTHFDHDHAREGWARVAATTGLRLRCAASHRPAALARGYPSAWIETFDPRAGGFDLGPIRVEPCVNPHDEAGTVSFRIETDAGSLGFATDVGRVSDALVDLLRGVDLLAIESNYDRDMQIDSARPKFLKDRIMGGRGHLSNEECLEAVREIAFPDEPAQVVLIHLSRDCNHPNVVRGLWSRALPALAPRLAFAHHAQPTPVFRLRGGALERAAEGAAP